MVGGLVECVPEKQPKQRQVDFAVAVRRMTSADARPGDEAYVVTHLERPAQARFRTEAAIHLDLNLMSCWVGVEGNHKLNLARLCSECECPW